MGEAAFCCVRYLTVFFPLNVEGFSENETTWLPVNENYKQLNLEAQKAAEKSHYKVYKQLTALRNKPAIKEGRTHVAALSDGVLGFTRYCSYFEPAYIIWFHLVKFSRN